MTPTPSPSLVKTSLNPPNRGNQLVFERGKLFRRFHFQNRQNADEIDSASDNLRVESDS